MKIQSLFTHPHADEKLNHWSRWGLVFKCNENNEKIEQELYVLFQLCFLFMLKQVPIYLSCLGEC